MTYDPDCLFCDGPDDPCAQHAKTKAKRKPAPRPVEKPTVRPVETASVDFESFASKPGSRFAKHAEVEVDPAELIDREAIRNLWDILAPESQRQFYKFSWPNLSPASSKRKADLKVVLDENGKRQ